MKAIVMTEYGSPDVLRLVQIEKPAPKDNEVLVKVFAVSVNFGDLTARNFGHLPAEKFHMPAILWFLAATQFGFRKPRTNILGNEFAGEIEAVGKNVTRFKPGDAVFGYRGQNMGTNAEYLCMAEDGMIAPTPASMTCEEATVIPYGGLTALTLLRRVNIQPGQKILVNGASGAIGSYAVQLARYYGADVTGVCGTPRVEMVKALGANRVIDYTREDFTQRGETYDVVFDVLGKGAFNRWQQVLNPGGRYLLASFKMRHIFQMLRTRKSDKRVICALSNEKPQDLHFLKELAEAGHLKAIIDRCYPLEQTAEAHRYVEAGGRTASVVIRVAQPAPTVVPSV